MSLGSRGSGRTDAYLCSWCCRPKDQSSSWVRDPSQSQKCSQLYFDPCSEHSILQISVVRIFPCSFVSCSFCRARRLQRQWLPRRAKTQHHQAPRAFWWPLSSSWLRHRWATRWSLPMGSWNLVWVRRVLRCSHRSFFRCGFGTHGKGICRLF